MRHTFKIYICLLILGSVSQLSSQAPLADVLEVVFQNGVHLRIGTKRTEMGRQNTLSGELAVKTPDVVHRLFTDAQNRLGFGYDLDTVPDKNGNGIIIHVRPLDKSILSVMRDQKLSLDSSADGKLPTFQKEREIGPVRMGDVVSLEVLTNPSTGDKIIDEIEVLSVADKPIASTPFSAPSMPVQPQFKFSDVRILLNGKELTLDKRALRSITGRFPVLYVPGHGSFFIALEPLKDIPFIRAGTVNGTRLQFWMGSDSIECISSALILDGSNPAQIWIWHEKNFRPSIPEFNPFLGHRQEDGPQIAVADSIEVWRRLVLKRGGSL